MKLMALLSSMYRTYYKGKNIDPRVALLLSEMRGKGGFCLFLSGRFFMPEMKSRLGGESHEQAVPFRNFSYSCRSNT